MPLLSKQNFRANNSLPVNKQTRPFEIMLDRQILFEEDSHTACNSWWWFVMLWLGVASHYDMCLMKMYAHQQKKVLWNSLVEAQIELFVWRLETAHMRNLSKSSQLQESSMRE